ncbi:MAG: hypothetical protein JSV49_11495 [Thermoplasmata archaeon]|nr:MAG: hypothetical protein JSV49_11495 [Thermoplasmata archaeon]
MNEVGQFPAWERIIEYFENSSEELISKIESENNMSYEELLNIETYQLWKILKKM